MRASRGSVLASTPSPSPKHGTGPTIAQGSIDNTDACAGVDEYVNLMRVTGGEGGAVFTHVARFRMPFTYTLIPLF